MSYKRKTGLVLFDRKCLNVYCWFFYDFNCPATWKRSNCTYFKHSFINDKHKLKSSRVIKSSLCWSYVNSFAMNVRLSSTVPSWKVSSTTRQLQHSTSGGTVARCMASTLAAEKRQTTLPRRCSWRSRPSAVSENVQIQIIMC